MQIGKTYQTLIALSLMLVSTGLFSACNKQETTPRSSMEVGRSEVREIPQAESLQQLPAGYPLSYYPGQFERLGYNVQNMDYQTDQVRYELKKENEVYQVSLMHPAQVSQVNKVEVKQLGWFETGKANDQATVALQEQISKLPAGKKPDEYVPLLDKYGTITEYKLDQNQNRATVNMTTNQKRYKVYLDVNPSTQTVTNISLEKGFLQMAG